MNMRQLRTLVVCAVVLLGAAVDAEDEALLQESPAADHLSEATLSEHYHHADLNAAEDLAGSTPSGNYDDLEADTDSSSSSTSDDYWGADHDAYENDGDYWGSEAYDCEYYDDDYDDDYGRYASEWFSGESEEALGAEPDVPPAHSQTHAHSHDSHPSHGSKEGNVREMDVN